MTPITDDGCEHCGRYCICGRLIDETAEEDEPTARNLAEVISALDKRLTPPMAVQLSRAEQDHIATLRMRSYQLAIQRGHIRR